ncbi:MAG TPA: hypothetical protein VNK67_05405 [Burkholderiales bacterium]|nr:hypothetical protein [Burkholderiales bacterium]
MSRQFLEMFDLSRWAEWFAQLDREFLFLLALPFVVAVIGLWASFLEKDREDGEDGK